jgi:hypothetical protein
MNRTSLDTYVVYFSPIDFPGQYVVRRHDIGKLGAGGATIVSDPLPMIVCSTLEEARRVIPPDKVRLEPSYEDAETIVESWL